MVGVGVGLAEVGIGWLGLVGVEVVRDEVGIGWRVLGGFEVGRVGPWRHVLPPALPPALLPVLPHVIPGLVLLWWVRRRRWLHGKLQLLLLFEQLWPHA